MINNTYSYWYFLVIILSSHSYIFPRPHHTGAHIGGFLTRLKIRQDWVLRHTRTKMERGLSKDTRVTQAHRRSATLMVSIQISFTMSPSHTSDAHCHTGWRISGVAEIRQEGLCTSDMIAYVSFFTQRRIRTHCGVSQQMWHCVCVQCAQVSLCGLLSTAVKTVFVNSNKSGKCDRQS